MTISKYVPPFIGMRTKTDPLRRRDRRTEPKMKPKRWERGVALQAATGPTTEELFDRLDRADPGTGYRGK